MRVFKERLLLALEMGYTGDMATLASHPNSKIAFTSLHTSFSLDERKKEDKKEEDKEKEFDVNELLFQFANQFNKVKEVFPSSFFFVLLHPASSLSLRLLPLRFPFSLSLLLLLFLFSLGREGPHDHRRGTARCDAH